jgi:hypothetical protein
MIIHLRWGWHSPDNLPVQLMVSLQKIFSLLDPCQRLCLKSHNQAFFYRSLPYVEPRKPSMPAWDYDFACLLAYDASSDGSLKRAWDRLDNQVKRAFWKGANVYVIMLGGTGVL